VLRVAVRLSARSALVQRIVLARDAVRLDFATEVDWDENRRFLKVEFPTTVFNAQATFETQFGHLQRPTHRNTSWDWAKFEVCAHKWADLSEYGFGVALLNDCKYGHAVEGSVMRLSLLRSPKAPDATCDIGHHSFVYSVMPHSGSFQAAGVIQEAYNLNVPLVLAPADSAVCPSAPPLFDVSHKGVILETVKRAEEPGEHAVVVRLYEAHGGTHTVTIRTSLPYRRVETVNILEEPISESPWQLRPGPEPNTVLATFTPFRILTLKYHL
jgi:alpha-mannosidase